jgi:phage baseplate assembly protein W
VTLPVVPNPTVSVPHLAIPFGLDEDGAAQVVEQDTVEEVAQCVQVLLATVEGQRQFVPTYGIPDPAFVGLDEMTAEQAIADWEPRASVSISVADPPANDLQVTVALMVEEDGS